MSRDPQVKIRAEVSTEPSSSSSSPPSPSSSSTSVNPASQPTGSNMGPGQIDRVLRRIAVAHAALDADEAHWLRIAEERKIWPTLGYVHAYEYLEDVFGYAPRTAMEKLRVARELGKLPQLEDALR